MPCCHAQGRGKSGVDEVQLSTLDAAVEALEADGGIPVRSASTSWPFCMHGDTGQKAALTSTKGNHQDEKKQLFLNLMSKSHQDG